MAMQPEVAIYTTPTCTFCAAAKRWFAEHGVAYSEYDVTRDPQRANELFRLTGQGSVPAIRVGGQLMLGFDPLQLARLLPNATRVATAAPSAVSLGMAAQSLTPERAAELGLVAPFGVVVGTVRDGGPAALAGLVAGDVITGIGSYTLQNLAQLQAILLGKQPGDSLTLRVWRGGEEFDATISFPAAEAASAPATTPPPAPSGGPLN